MLAVYEKRLTKTPTRLALLVGMLRHTFIRETSTPNFKATA